ncbi:MAG: aminotransferase class I/II-fold pyridoxal phosphate-dependent enzyme [Deltaproteobacteria bacterium]|nr:aminotransferase class I/II-fold pyridoxal phosphate-dependent enzyme [Deltaproteobacteria bacterium]
MDASRFREAVARVHSVGRARGHYFLKATDKQFVDREVTIDGRRLLSFGSCSYLGLEFDQRLIEGGIEAFRRYGSQTSYSRGYLSCPLYQELEEELFPRLFGVEEALLVPSTSIAHHVVMPAIISERTAVVSDHQVHRSVDDALTLQCARSHATKVMIRHGELDQALDVVRELSRKHETVWFCCDGVYSMYGDYLPSAFLREVLDVAPNVRMYIDDAHGMSWSGVHGRGHFLNRFAMDPRVVVVTSLAKAFGSGGGVVVTSDRALLETARLVGGPYSFSGPLRPGDLGVCVASARLHLTSEITELQERLAARVELANQLCRSLKIPTVIENEAPIRFIALGRAEAVYRMSELLRDDGFHVNVSGFPAVPASLGGVRIAINALHTEEEIRSLFENMARHLPQVLAETGVTRDEVQAQFNQVLPPFMRGQQTEKSRVISRTELMPREQTSSLNAQTFERIAEVHSTEWDAVIDRSGYVDRASLTSLEQVFHSQNELPEERWGFRYVLVERDGELVAAAPFSISPMKDDAFMHESVSAALETVRLTDRSYFVAPAMVLGTMGSEGEHLYLRDGEGQSEALVALLDEATRTMRLAGVDTLILRDMLASTSHEQLLIGQGFVPMPLMDTHTLALTATSPDELIAQGTSRRQRKFLKQMQSDASRFEVSEHSHGALLSREEVDTMHAMYLRLAEKNLRLNFYPFPRALLETHLTTLGWRVLVLRDHAQGGRIVAWGAGRKSGSDLRWLYCGVDYDGFANVEVSPYRQLLWQAILLAMREGCDRVMLGMGADREKSRFGTIAERTVAFVRADDSFRAQQLQEFVQNLAAHGAKR